MGKEKRRKLWSRRKINEFMEGGEKTVLAPGLRAATPSKPQYHTYLIKNQFELLFITRLNILHSSTIARFLIQTLLTIANRFTDIRLHNSVKPSP
jgi:hypothetical protein